MPRAGLGATAVIERGAELLDEAGPEGLNLAALAESLGVRVPSLYKHIDGMPGLRRGIMIRAKADLGHAMGQAAIGRSREDAIRALSFAYREWALQHPGQYPLTVQASVPGDDEDAAVTEGAIDVIFTVLAGYILREEDAIHATRFLRSALHGFVSLETGGGFRLPVGLDTSYERLIDSVVTALEGWSRA